MTRTRASKLCSRARPLAASLGLIAALTGCAPPAGSEAPALVGQNAQATYDASAPSRRPDAVVVEPPPAMPNPAERAESRGVVALRQPLGGDAVRDVVLAMVDAWQHESLEQMVALLTNDAGPIDARSRGRTVLMDSWRQRLRAHEYHRLAGVNLVRAERIERYGWEDLSAPDTPVRPPDMHTEELYVRVPLEVTRVTGERLFGDTMLLLLRREQGKYRIAAYGETEGP